MPEEEMIELKARILALEKRLDLCEKRCAYLEKQFHALEEDKAVNQVKDLTGGSVIPGKPPYDIILENGIRLEVKFSSVLSNPNPQTKRCSWNNVYKGSKFDFLVLLGNKNPDYHTNYPHQDERYVCFLIPQADILKIAGPQGNQYYQVKLVTSLKPRNGSAKAQLLIKQYLNSEAAIKGNNILVESNYNAQNVGEYALSFKLCEIIGLTSS